MNNGELAAMELIPAVLSIVLIDIVLSGDNALIIGLAAHRLPPAQRRLAIVMGGGAAIGSGSRSNCSSRDKQASTG